MESTQDQLELFTPDILANLSVTPGTEKAKMMTVISGQKLSAYYKRSDPIGSLVRTLLDTSHWDSTKCLMTWNTSGTPRNRLLFQLSPLTRTMKENGCLSLPTPSANDGPGYYVLSLQQAQNRIRTGRQMHWMHVAILYHGWKKCWANPRFSEMMMGFPKDWTKVN